MTEGIVMRTMFATERVLPLAALALAINLLLAGPALAWNDKGHMVVAELAYRRLTPQQRQELLEILKQHPHWAEFLNADRPQNVPEDQWSLWRAATWPDWVKHHHEQFSKPHWHYVNLPFVPPGSTENAQNHEPVGENILTALPLSIEKARGATGQEKAMYLCWVLHLMGDIHQPLHCADLVCAEFPKGDHGGEDSLYRLSGRRIIKLHSFWDDLLGTADTKTSIERGADEAQQAVDANRAEITRELQTNPTIESWARESFALATTYAYDGGRVIPAVAERHQQATAAPDLPEPYAQQAGLVARVCVGKAGERLAVVLAQIVP
jgi:hypothetical protein